MSRVFWSRTAQTDLASIDAHYAAIAPAFADEVARAAVAAGRFLLRFPHAGPRSGLGDTRKWRVRGTPYLLFYRVDGRDIEIVRVRHAQQASPDL
jgi:toxin ParE1/3/4